MADDCGDYGAEIWWWNNDTGKYDAHAYWYTGLYGDKDGEIELGYAGWGDEEFWMPITKTFAAGEAFWIQANTLDATLTVAGQIASASSTEQYVGIDLKAEKKVQLASPFPVSISIQDIKMADACGDYGAEIWWWNNDTGKYDAHAYWYTGLYGDKDGEIELGYAGWGDEEFWMPITKEFASGSGFWIQANTLDSTVKFPNPFYSAE